MLLHSHWSGIRANKTLWHRPTVHVKAYNFKFEGPQRCTHGECSKVMEREENEASFIRSRTTSHVGICIMIIQPFASCFLRPAVARPPNVFDPFISTRIPPSDSLKPDCYIAQIRAHPVGIFHSSIFLITITAKAAARPVIALSIQAGTPSDWDWRVGAAIGCGTAAVEGASIVRVG